MDISCAATKIWCNQINKQTFLKQALIEWIKGCQTIEETAKMQKSQEYEAKQFDWTKLHLINAKGYICFTIHKTLCTINTLLNLIEQYLLNKQGEIDKNGAKGEI